MFDGVEVRAVGWEEKHLMPLLGGDGFQVFLFVERGVIPDEGGMRPQFLAKHVARPGVDQFGMRGSLEQQGREKVLAAPRGDQAGSRVTATGLLAVHFPSFFAPPVAASHLRREARFIDIHQVSGTAFRDDPTQRPQVGHALLGIALSVLQRLFFGVILRAFNATHTAL